MPRRLSEIGWAPPQVTGGVSVSSAPDWTDQATWDRAQREAQELLSGGQARGYGNGVLRSLSMAQNSGDSTPLINAIAAQYTPGGQFGNPELANGIVKAGIIGTGIGSAVANLGGGAVATGGGGGATASTPLAGAPITGTTAGAAGPASVGGMGSIGPNGAGVASPAAGAGGAAGGGASWFEKFSRIPRGGGGGGPDYNQQIAEQMAEQERQRLAQRHQSMLHGWQQRIARAL